MYVDRFEFVGGPLDGNELLPDEPQDFNAGEFVGVPLPSGIQVYQKRDNESDYWDYHSRVVKVLHPVIRLNGHN